MKITLEVPIGSDISAVKIVELSDEQILAIGDRYFELQCGQKGNPDKHRFTGTYKCRDCKYLKRVIIRDKVRYICTSETRTRNYHNQHNKYDFKYESQSACKSGFELRENSASE